MKLSFLRAFTCLCGVYSSGAYADGVAAPVKRQEVVATAAELYVRKDNSVAIPKDVVNPFVGLSEVDEQPTVGPSLPSASLVGRDLLEHLAVQIPASGTVNLGGEWILLVGQKRLKVGDGVRINFEGQPYELFIASIAATNFTVRRGDMLYTRPVR